MCNTNTVAIVINFLLLIALTTLIFHNVYEIYKSIKFYKKLEQRHNELFKDLDDLKKEIKDKDETTI